MAKFKIQRKSQFPTVPLLESFEALLMGRFLLVLNNVFIFMYLTKVTIVAIINSCLS